MNMILIAFGFNCLDFITGFIASLKTGNTNSTVMRNGLFHKAGMVFLYILGYAIDYAGKYIDLPITGYVVPTIVTYVVLMELISVIENISKMNENLLPETLKKLIGLGDSNEQD